MRKNVLFLVPYPLKKAPSQRFRVENYFAILQQNNITYDVESFLNEETWSILYEKSKTLKKIFGIIIGFLKRLKTILFSLNRYDFIFIHREAAPMGPPIFEWFICKVYHKKIIYDFDDAIWIEDGSKENKLNSWLKA